MKKLFIYLFLFCTTASVFAAKQSGKIGPNATWNYDSGSKEFRISGTGVTYDGSYSYNGMYQAAPKKRNARMDSPNGAITFKYGAQLNGDAYTFNPDDVISIVVDEGITKLGEWTCAFFHNAKSVSLPKTLTNLCGGAFLDNTSLSNVTIPVNVDTMNVAICKSANSIYGDDINYGAFGGCVNLKTIYWNARGNKSGTILDPLTGLSNIVNKIVLGETVEHIPEGFCTNFKLLNGELIIEKNVKSIGYGAFMGCTGINKITLRADSMETYATPFRSPGPPFSWAITSNYESPFANCSKSMEIFIAKNVKYIGAYLFSDYYQFGRANKANQFNYEVNKNNYLDSLFITFEEGSCLESIGKYAFAGAKGLANLVLPSTVKSIECFAFYDTDLKSIIIPEATWSIGGSAFGACHSLDTIFYNAVGAYVASAHYPKTTYEYSPWEYRYESPFLNGPDNLLVILGDSVKYIGSYMFAKTGIHKLFIPENVSGIAPYAFSGCKLDTVWCNARGLRNYSFTDWNNEAIIYASPFTNGSDTTVFIIGENVTQIPSYFFSKYEYKAPLNWQSPSFTAYFSKKQSNHFRIQFASNSKISYIGSCAFAGNLELTDLTTSNQCVEIGKYAFAGCDSITHVQMNGKSTRIGAYIFSGCNHIRKVEWNMASAYDYFDSIQEAPFYHCAENIKSFRFGKDVGYIPKYLCANMTSLTSMTISESFYAISDSAFFNCIGIDTFYVHPTYPPRLGKEAFPTDANIKVKCVAKDEYLNDTVWNKNNITSECLLSYFTVRFLITDGTVLQEELVREGDIPVYKGETPQRAEDQYYTYTFKGWSPELAPVKYNTNYYAVFESHWKDNDEDEGINDVKSENSSNKILYNGRIYILRGNNIYTITGQKINIDK